MMPQPVRTSAWAGERRDPRSFTLVEMMVAISVVVLLAALTLSATLAVVERSEIRQTEATLKLLDLGLTEWETEADRKLSWGECTAWQTEANREFDMCDDTPHVFTLTEALRIMRRSDAVKQVLAQIKPARIPQYDTTVAAPAWVTLVDPDDPDPNAAGALAAFTTANWIDGELAVLDSWGTPIRAVHPGYVKSSGPRDPDGTVFVDDVAFYGTELYYGRCEGRRMHFVSAGPDGKFGNLGADEDDPQHAFAHDNVWSYAVVDEEHE